MAKHLKIMDILNLLIGKIWINGEQQKLTVITFDHEFSKSFKGFSNDRYLRLNAVNVMGFCLNNLKTFLTLKKIQNQPQILIHLINLHFNFI